MKREQQELFPSPAFPFRSHRCSEAANAGRKWRLVKVPSVVIDPSDVPPEWYSLAPENFIVRKCLLNLRKITQLILLLFKSVAWDRKSFRITIPLAFPTHNPSYLTF